MSRTKKVAAGFMAAAIMFVFMANSTSIMAEDGLGAPQEQVLTPAAPPPEGSPDEGVPPANTPPESPPAQPEEAKPAPPASEEIVPPPEGAEVPAAAPQPSEENEVKAPPPAVQLHTVTFYDVHGNVFEGPLQVENGGYLAAPGTAPPPPTGAVVFSGWIHEATGAFFSFSATPITTDVSLVAAYTNAASLAATPPEEEAPVAPQEYYIIFTDASGSEIARQTVEEGGTPNAGNVPVTPPEGLRFVHWYAEGTDAAIGYNFSAPVAANITLLPHFDVADDKAQNLLDSYCTYEVEYHGNGHTSGRVPKDDKNYKKNQHVILQNANLEKNGQKFIGWQIDARGNILKPGDKVKIYDDLDLCAVYEEKEYITVTFNHNGGDTPAVPGTMQTEKGTALGSLPQLPTRAGYIFDGWKYQNGKQWYAFNAQTKVSKDLTVYAQWQEIPKVTVTFNHNGGDTPAVPSTMQTQKGTALGSLPQPPTRAGYTFDGWEYQNGKHWYAFNAQTEVNKDLTVYAQWKEIPKVTVTFNHNGGDTPAVPGTMQTEKGAALGSLPQPPTRAGYTFDGWKYQNGKQWYAFNAQTKVSKDLTVYAQWQEIKKIDIVFDGKTISYDGREHTLDNASATVRGHSDGIQIYYGTDGKNYKLHTPPSYTEAGQYTVYAKAFKQGYPTVYASAVLHISPFKITITANPASKDFEAPEPTLTAKVSPQKPHGGDALVYSVTRDTSKQSVGTHYGNIKVQLGKNPNYTIETKPAPFTIRPSCALQVNFEGKEEIYNDTPYHLNAATVTGAGGAKVCYAESKKGPYTLKTPPAYTEAGSYKVWVKASKNGYITKYSVATLVIRPKTVVVAADSKTVEYNRAWHSINTFTHTQLPAGHTLHGVTAAGRGKYPQSQAYPVTINLQGAQVLKNGKCITKNYILTPQNGALTIVQTTPLSWQVNIQNSSTTYNGKAHTLQGIVTNLPDGYVVEGLATQGHYTNAGTHKIGLAYGQNFTILDEEGHDVTQWHASRATVRGGQLTIRPAQVTIHVNAAGKTHGAKDPAFTGSVTGLYAKNALGTVRYHRALCCEGLEGVGNEVTITASYGQNPNYVVAVKDAKLTIEKRKSSGQKPSGGQDAPQPGPNSEHNASAAYNRQGNVQSGPSTPPNSAADESGRQASIAPAKPSAAAPPAAGGGTNIPNENTALAQLPASEEDWGLLNLILCILSFAFAVALLVNLARRRREAEHKNTGIIWGLLGILAGVASPVIFLLTQNVLHPIKLMDEWTLLLAVILAVQLAVVIVGRSLFGKTTDRQARE